MADDDEVDEELRQGLNSITRPKPEGSKNAVAEARLAVDEQARQFSTVPDLDERHVRAPPGEQLAMPALAGWSSMKAQRAVRLGDQGKGSLIRHTGSLYLTVWSLAAIALEAGEQATWHAPPATRGRQD